MAPGSKNQSCAPRELKSQSSAENRLVSWRDQILAKIPIPAEIPSSLILHSLPLLDLVGKSGASVEDARNSSIAIERRWSAAGLSGGEILETLAQVYGLLCDIVLDAHVALKRCECIPKEGDHPNFRSTYHRTGTLECMVAGAEKRTQRFDCSGDELEPVVISRSTIPEEIEAANRYEFPMEGEIAAWRRSDPAQVTETILYRAERILCKDRCHPRIMFIRDGDGRWHNAALFAADATEKHLLTRLAAVFVERKGCDAIIEVGEMWMTKINRPGAGGASVEAAKGHREALCVSVVTREGFLRTHYTPFKRGPFGGVKLGETKHTDALTMHYLAPIFEVWKRQGYQRIPGGGTMHRMWEPDPLDVCFCGGPRRFAECCQPFIANSAILRNEVDSLIASSNFVEAEKYARASLAQYVIWVKQHTVPTMNVAEKLHRDFVEMDILALQSIVYELERSQEANGTADSLVPQLRHLADIVGIPRISFAAHIAC
jgi:hypothetical protein